MIVLLQMWPMWHADFGKSLVHTQRRRARADHTRLWAVCTAWETDLVTSNPGKEGQEQIRDLRITQHALHASRLGVAMSGFAARVAQSSTCTKEFL